MTGSVFADTRPDHGPGLLHVRVEHCLGPAAARVLPRASRAGGDIQKVRFSITLYRYSRFLDASMNFNLFKITGFVAKNIAVTPDICRCIVILHCHIVIFLLLTLFDFEIVCNIIYNI